jgi:transposase
LTAKALQASATCGDGQHRTRDAATRNFRIWAANALDARIDEMTAPFTAAAQRLDEIPGVNLTIASVILAEIGIDMGRFPTAGHLVSWAKFAPGVKESAGKKQGKNSTGHGNSYLARVLGNAAVAAWCSDTFLGERYRRIARRRGKKKAVVAIGRSLLVIISLGDLGVGLAKARK